jgi:hypothetical protein
MSATARGTQSAFVIPSAIALVTKMGEGGSSFVVSLFGFGFRIVW